MLRDRKHVHHRLSVLVLALVLAVVLSVCG